MMKIFYTFFMLLCSSALLISQSPELVLDYTTGEVGSFDDFNNRGFQFGDDILVPLVDAGVGEELGIISDGELRILKDINPGPDGGEPEGFISYGEYVYFTATDTEGSKVWRTDGTQEGTEVIFDGVPSTTARRFTVADDGWLYFQKSNTVFRTNGTDTEELETFNRLQAANNFTVYNNGVAVLDKNGDDSFSLIHLSDGNVTELARTPEADFFADGIQLGRVSNGLMFSVFDSDDDGLYHYNETDGTLSLYPIDGEQIPARNIIDYDSNSIIAWIPGKGYYNLNGVTSEEERLVESGNTSGSGSFKYVQYQDKLLFLPISGIFFEDEFMVYTDGSAAETNLLPEVDTEHNSSFVRYGNYAYLARRISNNFQPSIVQVDMEDGTATEVFAFEERARESRSVLPLGVQGGYLYFISKLDDTVGAELYRIQLDVMMVNTDDAASGIDYSVTTDASAIRVELDQVQNINVTLHTIAGQKVFQKNVKSNEFVETNLDLGMYVLTVRVEGKVESRVVHVGR